MTARAAEYYQRRPALVRAHQVQRKSRYTVRGEYAQEALPGDYVVTYETGEKAVYPPELFHSLFIRLNNNEKPVLAHPDYIYSREASLSKIEKINKVSSLEEVVKKDVDVYVLREEGGHAMKGYYDLYRESLRFASVPAWLWTRQRLTFVNAKAEKVLGYRAEDLRRMSMADLIASEDQARYQQLMEYLRPLPLGEFAETELQLVTAEGKQLQTTVEAAKAHDANGSSLYSAYVRYHTNVRKQLSEGWNRLKRIQESTAQRRNDTKRSPAVTQESDGSSPGQ